MLKDKFEELMTLLVKGREGKGVQLEAIFKLAGEFFELLKVEMHRGNAQEKREAIIMLMEFYNRMEVESQELCKKGGVSAEELEAIADNPNNYTQEQWRLIQESKENMRKLSDDIGVLVKESAKPPVSPAALLGGLPPKSKKSKKSNWMRS